MKKYLLSIFCAVLLLPGCNYLEMVPEKDIETIESIFEQQTRAENWWKGIYGKLNEVIVPVLSSVHHMGADEFVVGRHLYNSTQFPLDGIKVSEGLQMSQDPYGEAWSPMYVAIRNSNIFIENIDNTHNLTEEERNWWKADVKALKAFTYFELVRRYGPICLVPDNLPMDLDVSEYQLPRVHVDTCFKEIIRLLDESMEFVPRYSQRSPVYGHTFCLEAVYALKARVLLYAASPLFNGNAFYSDFKGRNGEPLFSQTYDHNKWLLAAQAADKAAEMCEQGGRKLARSNESKGSKLLNHILDIEVSSFSRFSNEEYLLEWRTGNGYFMLTLPLLEGDEVNFDGSLMGTLSPSMKMVEMYYTDHGLPINVDNTWSFDNRYKQSVEVDKSYEKVVPLNTTMVNLHRRREPRFYASIAGDRMYWQRGTNTPTTDLNLLVQAHKDESWGTRHEIIVSNNYQNISGYWLKKHTFSWIPTRSYSSGLQGNESVPLIRLAEVFLMQAEAWNEYLDVPDARVYDPLDKVRGRAGILPVREAWGLYSNDPTRVDSKVGMRDIIQQECNIEFAFEGHRYWNLRRWLIAQQTLNEKQYGWNILGTSHETFYNNGEGPIVLWNRNKFQAPRDYLQPFNAEEILVSGMVQNPGW